MLLDEPHSNDFSIDYDGDHCDDSVEVSLQEPPLGDRVVIDMHTGQVVSVRTYR